MGEATSGSLVLQETSAKTAEESRERGTRVIRFMNRETAIDCPSGKGKTMRSSRNDLFRPAHLLDLVVSAFGEPKEDESDRKHDREGNESFFGHGKGYARNRAFDQAVFG